ncbi:MAG: hypothetical protein KKH32_10750 [Bacteroidetes bacterium]|nr:hypothetical protein [Bacteroidota bacterium]
MTFKLCNPSRSRVMMHGYYFNPACLPTCQDNARHKIARYKIAMNGQAMKGQE